MKTGLTILILTICVYFSHGQNYSLTIDSLTRNYIEKLPKDKRKKFDAVLNQRHLINLSKRIDTTVFDYAFIEEKYCYYDSIINMTERSFLSNDSIPKYVFINGTFSDPKKIYDGFLIWYSKNVTFYFTLKPLIDKYSKLKTTQIYLSNTNND
jgi:hypothetical protein